MISIRDHIKMGTSILSLAAIVFIAGCKSAGDPGPNGTDGTTGNNGLNGAKGVGYAEATRDGHIVLILEGAYGDGQFKDTIDYRFNSLNVYESEAQNYGNNIYRFDIKRYAGLDFTSDESQEDYIDLSFQRSVASGEHPVSMYATVNANLFVGPNYYFTINDNFYNNDNDNLEDEHFTNFSYDSEHGSLKMSFDFIILGENNSTGSDLKVTGMIDVKVYEYINPG